MSLEVSVNIAANQCSESVESVLKKKKKATVGRICREEGFDRGVKQGGRCDENCLVA